MPRRTRGPVSAAFEQKALRIAIGDIQPLKLVTPTIRSTKKYSSIAASIREVGIIEPPVVARDRQAPGKFLLLDGHLRLDILLEAGHAHIDCLVSTDDETFTYNRRVNRLAIIQEHRMIQKAVEQGVPAIRIAKALNLDLKTVESKMRLLNGICPEAVELLRDRHVSQHTFWQLKRMSPLRQIEAAELMVAMNRYSTSYARSLLAATPADQLVERRKPRATRSLTPEQVDLMERESANLDRQFRMAEENYSANNLDLVLARGWLSRLLMNMRVARYLDQKHPDILAEFRKIATPETILAA